MSQRHLPTYEFGLFRLDTRDKQLLRDGVPVPLMPKAYEILALLIEKHGRLVEKEEILNEVWQGRFVEESNVAQNVHQLRKALGDSKHGPSHIETVPGRGYRFTAEVRESSPECDAPRLIYGDGARPAGETGGEPPPPARVGGLFLRGFNLRVAALALACLGSITAATMLWPRKEIAPEHAPRSLAVLPFRLVGPAGDDETLGLGLADALITKLSNSNTLPVLPTSSVFRFIEREHDPLEVGRELRVTTVLSGTVQRTGERVRVTVQLVDVAERRSLWAGSFDSRYANIFELQDTVSERIAEAMALRFTGYEKQQFAKRPTASVEAYEAYLMGIYFWNKRSEEALTKSVGYFQRATELDRNFAGAYAYMADAYAMTAANRYGERPDVALYERARAAATRALELDDTVPEAYLALSLVAFNLDRDSERAARLLKRTVSLNPNNAVARLRYGWHLAREGQLSDAVAELRMAQRLNPLSAHHNTSLAAILLFARDYDGAVGYAQRAIEIDPNYYTARLNLAEAYEMKGMYADALAELKKLRGSPREDAYTRAYMGRLLALSGDDGEARKVLAGLESQAGGSNALHYNMALIYSALGQRNETFRMLDKAITERIILAEVLRFDPRLDQLRSDPGYEEVLRRHNLSHLLPSTAPLQRPVKAEAAQTPAVVSWHTQGSGLPPRKP